MELIEQIRGDDNDILRIYRTNKFKNCKDIIDFIDKLVNDNEMNIIRFYLYDDRAENSLQMVDTDKDRKILLAFFNCGEVKSIIAEMRKRKEHFFLEIGKDYQTVKIVADKNFKDIFKTIEDIL